MISLRIHRHLKYIVIFALGFFAGGLNSANAQSLVDYSRTPSGSGLYDSITITATVDQQAVNDCLSTGANSFQVQIYTSNLTVLGVSDLKTPSTQTLNYVVNFTTAGNADYVILRCTPDVNFQFDLEIDETFPPNANFLFSTFIYVAPPPPPTPPTPEINFDFFGSTTDSSELISTVAGGVQDTSSDLWPLLAFLGVSLAFIIGLQLTVFTKRATTGLGMAQDGQKDTKHIRVRRLRRTSDYRAFRKGKKLNKADGIDLFPKE